MSLKDVPIINNTAAAQPHNYLRKKKKTLDGLSGPNQDQPGTKTEDKLLTYCRKLNKSNATESKAHHQASNCLVFNFIHNGMDINTNSGY